MCGFLCFGSGAGAALYAHKAFGVHFVTFIVAFAVASSGITSAATSATLVGQNILIGVGQFVDGVPTDATATMIAAIAIIVVLALINLRGVGESVKFNLVLTLAIIAATVAFLIVAAAQHNKAVSTCVSTYGVTPSNSNSASSIPVSSFTQGADAFSESGRDICNIFVWAQTGVMAGLIVLMGLTQFYMLAAQRAYGGEQRKAFREFHETQLGKELE